MTDNTRTQLAQAIVAWLKDPETTSAAGGGDLESAAHAIESAFALAARPAPTGPGLQTIFDVFLKTQQKLGSAAPQASAATAGSSSAAGSSSSTSAPAQPSAEDLAKAESHKVDGNKSMSAKDYGAAISSYSSAIGIHPASPIYFSNRAAAYSQIGQHDKAIEDARQAAKIDPSFSKAYSRLGHALFASGKYSEAVEAYQQGLLLDPENKLMKSGLDTAKAQAAKETGSSSAATDGLDAVSPSARGAGAGAGAGAGGFPGMGGGGMPDLASLMVSTAIELRARRRQEGITDDSGCFLPPLSFFQNNPMMASMAQNLMANGGLEQLMQNPMLRSMAERMGSGGGMPDMSQLQGLMNDPNMAAMARNLMGGMGGGAGAGGQGTQGGSESNSGSNNDSNNMFG